MIWRLVVGIVAGRIVAPPAGAPANALTLDGNALTLDGNYLTLA